MKFFYELFTVYDIHSVDIFPLHFLSFEHSTWTQHEAMPLKWKSRRLKLDDMLLSMPKQCQSISMVRYLSRFSSHFSHFHGQIPFYTSQVLVVYLLKNHFQRCAWKWHVTNRNVSKTWSGLRKRINLSSFNLIVFNWFYLMQSNFALKDSKFQGRLTHSHGWATCYSVHFISDCDCTEQSSEVLPSYIFFQLSPKKIKYSKDTIKWAICEMNCLDGIVYDTISINTLCRLEWHWKFKLNSSLCSCTNHFTLSTSNVKKRKKGILLCDSKGMMY